MCGHFWVIQMLTDWVGFATIHSVLLMTLNIIMNKFQCIGCNKRAIKLWNCLDWKSSQLQTTFLIPLLGENCSKMLKLNYQSYLIICTILLTKMYGLDKIWMGLPLQLLPTSCMHIVMVFWCTSSRFCLLNSTTKKKVSLIVCAMTCFKNLKSNQKQEYPHYMFSYGITNLTLLTAAEWVGVAFLLSMFTISA